MSRIRLPLAPKRARSQYSGDGHAARSARVARRRSDRRTARCYFMHKQRAHRQVWRTYTQAESLLASGRTKKLSPAGPPELDGWNFFLSPVSSLPPPPAPLRGTRGSWGKLESNKPILHKGTTESEGHLAGRGFSKWPGRAGNGEKLCTQESLAPRWSVVKKVTSESEDREMETEVPAERREGEKNRVGEKACAGARESGAGEGWGGWGRGVSGTRVENVGCEASGGKPLGKWLPRERFSNVSQRVVGRLWTFRELWRRQLFVEVARRRRKKELKKIGFLFHLKLVGWIFPVDHRVTYGYFCYKKQNKGRANGLLKWSLNANIVRCVDKKIWL